MLLVLLQNRCFALCVAHQMSDVSAGRVALSIGLLSVNNTVSK